MYEWLFSTFCSAAKERRQGKGENNERNQKSTCRYGY